MEYLFSKVSQGEPVPASQSEKKDLSNERKTFSIMASRSDGMRVNRSIVPSITVTHSISKVFRFASLDLQSFSVQWSHLFNLLCMASGVSNVKVLVGAVRIKRVSIYASSDGQSNNMAGVNLTWLDVRSDNKLKIKEATGGQDIIRHYKPPINSTSRFWQTDRTSSGVFSLGLVEGAIVDIEVDLNLINPGVAAVDIGGLTVVAGAIYCGCLGQLSTKIAPLGYLALSGS